MPSLKFLCSAFGGELAEGGEREFDFDPNNNGFFDFPIPTQESLSSLTLRVGSDASVAFSQ